MDWFCYFLTAVLIATFIEVIIERVFLRENTSKITKLTTSILATTLSIIYLLYALIANSHRGEFLIGNYSDSNTGVSFLAGTIVALLLLAICLPYYFSNRPATKEEGKRLAGR